MAKTPRTLAFATEHLNRNAGLCLPLSRSRWPSSRSTFHPSLHPDPIPRLQLIMKDMACKLGKRPMFTARFLKFIPFQVTAPFPSTLMMNSVAGRVHVPMTQPLRFAKSMSILSLLRMFLVASRRLLPWVLRKSPSVGDWQLAKIPYRRPHLNIGRRR
jgi:hypothetical protein